MSDPTKNLPWRVELHAAHDDKSWWVVDSRDVLIVAFRESIAGPEAERLARMVAQGSVAGELRAACRRAIEQMEDSGIFHGAPDTLNDALALSAPLFPEPTKETP